MRLGYVTCLISKLLTIAAMIICMPAYAASFDCRKANTDIEITVCSVPLLSSLDELMSYNYKVMLAADIGEGARADLHKKQRAWLSARDTCSSTECLIDAYKSRTEQICSYPVLTGIYPDCRSPY
jgi:uncharacterized protein